MKPLYLNKFFFIPYEILMDDMVLHHTMILFLMCMHDLKFMKSFNARTVALALNMACIMVR